MKNRTYFVVSIFCLGCVLFGISGISEARLTITIPPLNLDVLPGTGDLSVSPLPGSPITFYNLTVTVPRDHSGGTLSVSLRDVTNYKGYCINIGDSTDVDLKLLESDNLNWNQDPNDSSILTREIDGFFPSAGSTKQERVDGPWTVVVRSYDSAAYGKLTLSTTASHGNHSVTLTIPRDDNNNKIADGWENDLTRNYTGDEDNETGPAATTYTDANGAMHNIPENTHDKDGLTLFDEYRGAWLIGNSEPARFSPDIKDVFVMHRSTNLLSSGCGNASGFPLSCHVLHPNCAQENGTFSGLIVNKNTKQGNKVVIAIEIQEDLDDEEVDEQGQNVSIDHFGVASGKANIPDPLSWPKIIIYTTIISNWCSQNPLDNIPPVLTNSTISHEVGHCVNLNHCPASPIDDTCIMRGFYHRNQSAFGVHHNPDYDLIHPHAQAQPPDPTYEGNSGNISTTNPVIISTNTGPSTYGCDHNSEHDYCTDTGTCGSPSDFNTNGLCGHRWCICAAAGTETSTTPLSTPVTSTNTGPSIYGCDYNAEYDYCTDTGTCTTRTGSGEVGMCGHRWCCCAPQ